MGCCAAPNCSNRSDKGFRLYKFPRDPERRKKWTINCRRDSWTPTASSSLCEVHFEQSQFELNRLDGWKKLKPTAIPTIFPPKEPTEEIVEQRKIEIDQPESSSTDDSMVRHYKRRTDQNISEEAMNSAIEMVRQGSSLRKASLAHGLKRSTLRYRVHKLPFCNLQKSFQVCGPREKSELITPDVISNVISDLVSECEELSEQAMRRKHRQVFTLGEEKLLVAYLQQCCLMHNGLTNHRVRELALEYAQQIKCPKIPASWLKNGLAGFDWLYAFKSRHKELKLQKPEIL